MGKEFACHPGSICMPEAFTMACGAKGTLLNEVNLFWFWVLRNEANNVNSKVAAPNKKEQ
jgi:hypothetical protein